MTTPLPAPDSFKSRGCFCAYSSEFCNIFLIRYPTVVSSAQKVLRALGVRHKRKKDFTNFLRWSRCICSLHECHFQVSKLSIWCWGEFEAVYLCPEGSCPLLFLWSYHEALLERTKSFVFKSGSKRSLSCTPEPALHASYTQKFTPVVESQIAFLSWNEISTAVGSVRSETSSGGLVCSCHVLHCCFLMQLPSAWAYTWLVRLCT